MNAPQPIEAHVSFVPPAAGQLQAVVLRLRVDTRGEGIGHASRSLPHVRWTLPLAEAMHRALIRKAARGRRVNCPELTGQDRSGHPLTSAHRHSHVLPVDVDSDGALDHVVIYAPMGLGLIAQNAIGELRNLYSPDGKPWLRIQTARSFILNRWLFAEPSLGSMHDASWEEPGCEIRRAGAPAGAREWLSMTPFVPPRYLKKSGKNSLVGQVNAELASRHFANAEVTVLEELGSDSFELRRRRDHVQPRQQIAYGLRLRFAEPVVGPICLGYASHFGMGLFRARSETERNAK